MSFAVNPLVWMLMEDGSQSFLRLRRQILGLMYHLTGDYAHEHYVNFF